METTGHPIQNENVAAFVKAGRAVFTVVSKKTGARFTFRVQKGRDSERYFASVLTGADNTRDYQYLGTIFEDGAYRHGRKSEIKPTAPSAMAFDWFWRCLTANQLTSLDVHHEGRCARCARVLTVPESILTGFGPECAGKVAA
jgi:hypothetical protein